MIPYLDNIPDVHDTTFAAADGMILVNLWMRLVRAEEEYYARECINTPGHRII